jgi:hypothetical protein
VVALVALGCLPAIAVALPGGSTSPLASGDRVCSPVFSGPKWIVRSFYVNDDHASSGNRYFVTTRKLNKSCAWALSFAKKLIHKEVAVLYPKITPAKLLPPLPGKGWICGGDDGRRYRKGAGLAKSPQGQCSKGASSTGFTWWPYDCLPDIEYSTNFDKPHYDEECAALAKRS